MYPEHYTHIMNDTIKNICDRMATTSLSANAPVFIPSEKVKELKTKVKKTKDQRACPRKRRRNRPSKVINEKNEEFAIRNEPIKNESNNKWIELQTQWLNSKQYLNDNDYLVEENERKKWRKWAIITSEIERKRRILEIQKIDNEAANERQRRQKWALQAIESERYERSSLYFLNSQLLSTNWFNNTILSSYNGDYELVCFYFRLGIFK